LSRAFEYYAVAILSLQSVKPVAVLYAKAGLALPAVQKGDQSVAHFEDSLGFCREAGFRPEVAWTCHDCAEVLLDRNGPGDRQKAMSLLDESLVLAKELGMRPLLERVESLQAEAQTRPGRAPAYPDGLTQREVEVLRLIASGKTNREIADGLFISVKTAGYHVGNILNKTACANRAEAAAYAARQGLVE
jgi:DNA-binding CsgD family transcriptional regulator